MTLPRAPRAPQTGPEGPGRPGVAIPESEAGFMGWITDLADQRGWSWVHFRPARTAYGWRTPVSGSLGKGWPDLVLVKRDRLLFVEVKSAQGRLDAEQQAVRAALVLAGATVYVWRPVDRPVIEEVLT